MAVEKTNLGTGRSAYAITTDPEVKVGHETDVGAIAGANPDVDNRDRSDHIVSKGGSAGEQRVALSADDQDKVSRIAAKQAEILSLIAANSELARHVDTAMLTADPTSFAANLDGTLNTLSMASASMSATSDSPSGVVSATVSAIAKGAQWVGDRLFGEHKEVEPLAGVARAMDHMSRDGERLFAEITGDSGQHAGGHGGKHVTEASLGALLPADANIAVYRNGKLQHDNVPARHPTA